MFPRFPTAPRPAGTLATALLGLGLCLMAPGCKVLSNLGKGKNAGDEESGADGESRELVKAPAEINIGEVAFVDLGQGFVLVKSPAATKFDTGTQLWAVSPKDVVEGERVSLIVSPEKNRSFLIADIKEGIPKKGDAVFAAGEELVIPDVRVIDPPESTTAEPAPAPETEAKKLPWYKRIFRSGSRKKKSGGEAVPAPVYEDDGSLLPPGFQDLDPMEDYPGGVREAGEVDANLELPNPITISE